MFSDPKVRKAYIWTIFACWVIFVIWSCVYSTQKMLSQNQHYRERAERQSTMQPVKEHNHAINDVLDSLEEYSDSFDADSHKIADPADETDSQTQKRKVTPYQESPGPLIFYIVLCVLFTIPLVRLAIHDKLLKLFVWELILVLLQLIVLNVVVLSTYTYMIH
ncbi:MAG: hypothetical protein IK106_02255 [Clostridiales bacterium]|nr:hypothetical protein [Clostridiales bacterium]